MHRIAFFAVSGHEILDLAGPLSAFSVANTLGPRSLYRISVLSPAGGMVEGSAGLPLHTAGSADDGQYDTVVFVGGDVAPMRRPEIIQAARELAARAPRLASVCTGSFLLAEIGQLDGRRATTHWARAIEFQRSYPKTHVDVDRIFIVDGHVWTSAGITAGIDLALAMIEADHGAELSRRVARYLVVPHRRPGGQSQFSAMSQMEPDSDRIRIALEFARAHLREDLSNDRLAEAAHLSPRQFARIFRRETSVTPAKAVEKLRVEAARLRIEEGSESLEQIARAVGFGDPERMRRAFVKLQGHPPQAVRRTLRAGRA
jgi:transcriptional regulator GlxA family with amidase domain